MMSGRASSLRIFVASPFAESNQGSARLVRASRISPEQAFRQAGATGCVVEPECELKSGSSGSCCAVRVAQVCGCVCFTGLDSCWQRLIVFFFATLSLCHVIHLCSELVFCAWGSVELLICVCACSATTGSLFQVNKYAGPNVGASP